jgi:hypothetical protein
MVSFFMYVCMLTVSEAFGGLLPFIDYNLLVVCSVGVGSSYQICCILIIYWKEGNLARYTRNAIKNNITCSNTFGHFYKHKIVIIIYWDKTHHCVQLYHIN